MSPQRIRPGTGRRRSQRSTNIPTVSFTELGMMMEGQRLNHKDMVRIWRAMCAVGGVVDKYTQEQFVECVLMVRDELFESGETATWKAIVQRALEHGCPSNFEFIEISGLPKVL